MLIDIIGQEKPAISEADLKKNITEYREIAGYNAKLADVADMVRKNIKIAKMTERITNALGGWEVEELKGIQEEIKADKVEGIE